MLAILSALGLVGAHMTGYSATDSQFFLVNVPARISIVPPNPGVSTPYGGTGNADIRFARQNWLAKSNSLTGATVLFETTTCFLHDTEATSKRDGRLALRVNSQSGPGLWTVSRASDTTNYYSGDEVARVQAYNNGPGQADLGLTVTFLTGIGADLVAGDYSLTVVGTITAN